MLKFFTRFFPGQSTDGKYRVLARRYLVPPNKQPVFQEFHIAASNPYEAARKFDQAYTAWPRLDVSTLN